MRVCPKCGHVDPPCWRSSIAHREIDFTRFDDFRENYSELAEKLLQNTKLLNSKNYIENGKYAYHLTRGGNVERQAKLDNPAFYHKWSIPVDGSPKKRLAGYVQCIKRPLPKGQKKLLEAKK